MTNKDPRPLLGSAAQAVTDVANPSDTEADAYDSSDVSFAVVKDPARPRTRDPAASD